MNNTIRSLVLLATLAVACPVFGQIKPSWIAPAYVLPPSLPIGDEDTIRNWAVSKTNGLPNQWSDVTLQYYTTNGQYAYIQKSAYVAFDTYDEYSEWVAGVAMQIASMLATNDTCPSNTNIGFWCDTYYNTASTGFPPANFVGLSEDGMFGPISTLSSNQFRLVRPKYVQAIVPVPLLSYFRIDVTTNIPCWYIWDNGVTASTNWPSWSGEWTRQGFACFNSWYSSANYRVRSTLCAGGQTNVYTQHGAIIKQGDMAVPVRIAPTKNSLNVNMPKGSDVLVETSFDLKHWQTLTNLPWSMGTNFTSIAIDQSRPAQYFRASAQ
jgi:hypothetical protein